MHKFLRISSCRSVLVFVPEYSSATIVHAENRQLPKKDTIAEPSSRCQATTDEQSYRGN